MDPIALIEAHAEELRAHGARKVGIFGSIARGQETPGSDVDIYLEFVDGMKTYDNFFAIHELLGSIFGRRVDLVTDGSLSEGKARIILPTVRYAAINA
jgi:predicted nucleotidyltransferase